VLCYFSNDISACDIIIIIIIIIIIMHLQFVLEICVTSFIIFSRSMFGVVALIELFLLWKW
jgi:hypothetical protein